MTAPDLHVSGGAGGVEARYEDLATLARNGDDLATGLGAISVESQSALADPDVVASAVLDPAGAARFEAILLSALDGRDGLTALAAGIGARSVALRAVAVSYHVADEAQARLLDTIRWTAGYAAAPVLLALALDPAALAALYGAYRLADGTGVDWQRLLTDHPGLVDNLVGAGPGLTSGLPGPLFASDVPSAAHLLGLLYPDGSPRVAPLGVDAQDPSMTQPPQGFGDLLSGLDYRNRQAGGADQGQIDVRVVIRPDGSRSYIVDVPGTKDWHPVPLRHNEYLNDLSTNVHGIAGDETAYERGIAEALRQAGAGPGEPVMLVGHSQGGIVAARAAGDLVQSGQFNVTHVVTAGSPVGRIPVPDQVQMLSLENEHDIVPHLDAADNPDRFNHTTVSFASQNGTIGDNHGIASAYLPAAAAMDSSTDPSVTAFRASADPFLGGGDGTRVTSYVYQVTRD